MAWPVQLHKAVEEWLRGLDERSRVQVVAAIDVLQLEGPHLGRPLADRVQGSRHHHMKELRPGSKGASEIRILFCFDPHRQAILLVAGDKAGDWNKWYRRNIPVADDRYDEHLRRTR